jgi:hypothetical protein
MMNVMISFGRLRSRLMKWLVHLVWCVFNVPSITPKVSRLVQRLLHLQIPSTGFLRADTLKCLLFSWYSMPNRLACPHTTHSAAVSTSHNGSFLMAGLLATCITYVCMPWAQKSTYLDIPPNQGPLLHCLTWGKDLLSFSLLLSTIVPVFQSNNLLCMRHSKIIIDIIL